MKARETEYGIPLSEPIYQTTIFAQPDNEQLGRMYVERKPGVYTRFQNPTLAAAGDAIAELEGAERGLVFASGMAAITTSLMAVLTAGDHVVCSRSVFAQTRNFLNETLRSLGVETSFVDATRSEAISEALRPNTRLVYLETPANPTLDISDIAAASTIAHDRGALLFVDSTFATPILQNPLNLGADLVLHSASKYLSGHGDLMCGAVAGGAELMERVHSMQILLGGIMDPSAAFLLLRGLKTLELRVAHLNATAQELASFLAESPGVATVYYPWIASSEQGEVARTQMKSGGAMISFQLESGLEGARAMLRAFKLISIATSLGGMESVVELPSALDFREAEIGAAAGEAGVSVDLVRLSVGAEGVDRLRDDLRRGLEAARHSAA